MVVLYVLLGIVAAVVLLLCVKITVEVRYEETARVELRVLFLRFVLMPRDKKPKKSKKEKPKKEPQEEKPKEEAPKQEAGKGESKLHRFVAQQGFDGVILFIRELLQVVFSLFGDIFKRAFVIQKLFLRFTVSKPDAASTALAYGKTCAAVYPALGCLCTQLRVRQYDALVRADYLASGSTAQMVFAVSVRPIKMIHAVLRFAFRALAVLLRTRKRAVRRKKEQDQLQAQQEQQQAQVQSVSIERNVDS